MPTDFTRAEHEVIVLKAIWELIDEMVNYEMFVKLTRMEDVELRFNTLIPEFYEWFHRNLFSYHSSAIAEFLNNIRWGMYDYLRPEFALSFTKDDPSSIAYRFKYPPDCNRPVARTMYWDLMNAVRSEPYMPRFEVTRYLKMRY
jgi:hypothetical protein